MSRHSSLKWTLSCLLTQSYILCIRRRNIPRSSRHLISSRCYRVSGEFLLTQQHPKTKVNAPPFSSPTPTHSPSTLYPLPFSLLFSLDPKLTSHPCRLLAATTLPCCRYHFAVTTILPQPLAFCRNHPLRRHQHVVATRLSSPAGAGNFKPAAEECLRRVWNRRLQFWNAVRCWLT